MTVIIIYSIVGVIIVKRAICGYYRKDLLCVVKWS